MADSPSQETHFCLLIHGLWGSPTHLQILADSIRAKHSADKLHILLAKSNIGNYTYDGVEKGAERIMREVEDELEKLEKDGKRVTKFSMTGYSMGGLVGRYVIGLLFSKGYLDKMEPINFTTFATPHLGTRAPVVGWSSNVYNALGSRTLSMSGKQLWCIDNFRDTGRPLLSIMADPDSIFMRALARFKNRFLYANIVNDRAVPFWTAYFSKIDPFTDLSAIDIHYVEGYENVIISESLAAPKEQQLQFYSNLAMQAKAVVYKLPFYLAVGIIGPIAALAFLGNAGVQSFQSAARIKQHEEGTAGIDPAAYHVPTLVEKIQHKTDQAIQRLAVAEGEDYVVVKDKDHKHEGSKALELPTSNTDASSSVSSFENMPQQPLGHDTIPDESNKSGFSTLALSEEQFAMKDALDNVGFQKFAVHIKNANHSHAAIIIRMQRPGFGEGKVVSRHWLERFEV